MGGVLKHENSAKSSKFSKIWAKLIIVLGQRLYNYELEMKQINMHQDRRVFSGCACCLDPLFENGQRVLVLNTGVFKKMFETFRPNVFESVWPCPGC